jgi:CPA1 family monovalent cation:H+ antiporter
MRADQRELISELAALPGLAECDARELRQLATAGRAVRLPAGWSVVQERTPADTSYLILSGTVAVTVGGEQVARLGAGDVFGEVGPLSGRLRNATVTSTSPLRVLCLPGSELSVLVAKQPHVADVLMAGYRRRVGSGV